MFTRRSYDYAKPTTIVLIISDALDHINRHTKGDIVMFADIREIVTDAYNALIANTGAEDANDMLLEVGIGAEDLDKVLICPARREPIPAERNHEKATD